MLFGARDDKNPRKNSEPRKKEALNYYKMQKRKEHVKCRRKKLKSNL